MSYISNLTNLFLKISFIGDNLLKPAVWSNRTMHFSGLLAVRWPLLRHSSWRWLCMTITLACNEAKVQYPYKFLLLGCGSNHWKEATLYYYKYTISSPRNAYIYTYIYIMRSWDIYLIQQTIYKTIILWLWLFSRI